MWNVRTQLAAKCKASFEPAGLDTSKTCHISAGNVRSRAVGDGRAQPEVGRLPKRICRCCVNACGSDKRGASVICSSDSEVRCQASNLADHRSDNSCDVSSAYSAARETDLEHLRSAAGFWVCIGTANDLPNMSL